MMVRSNFITSDQMKNITETILSKTGYPLQWNGSVEAVPIEDIIEIDYGIDWKWGHVNNPSSDGLVLAALYPKSREITLNESCRTLFKEKFGTMLFSLAHELGHWVLHVEDVTGMQLSLFENDVFYCRSRQIKSPIEYQADWFAGCLLMPEAILAPLIMELQNTKTIITWPCLYSIAKSFRVSITALTTRLDQLKLLYIDSEGAIHRSPEEAMGQNSLF